MRKFRENWGGGRSVTKAIVASLHFLTYFYTKIHKMLIELPDEILRKPGYGRDELMLDIAVMLYQRKQFSLGKAAKLAKQDRLEFQRTLAERGIEIIYDLDIDLDTLHAAG